MKNKTLVALLGAAVITAGTIGGVAFANSTNNILKENQQNIVKEDSIKANTIAVQNDDIEIEDTTKDNNSENANYNKNSANNPSKDIYQDMVKIMRENGFKDAARYMQTGDYDSMTDYMGSISQEDYDKMIEIMNDNGYDYMGQMMESVGREGMIQMHSSMGAMHGNTVNNSNYNNMMGGF